MTKISTTLLMLLFSATAYAQAENWNTIADRYHLSAYLVAVLLIGVFVLIFSNRLYYYREQEVSNHAKQLNAQLALVLNSNKTVVWTYDVTKIFTLISSDTVTKAVYAPFDFSQFYNHDDFGELRTKLTNVLIENSLSETLLVRSHNGQNTYEINISVLKRDQKHHPVTLLGVQRDITESKRRGEKTHELSLQYQTVFNSSLVDMIFYGPDGRLVDLNEKACETFMIADRHSFLKKNVHINDIPSYRHINIDELYDSIRLSSITDIDQVKQEDERIPDLKLEGTCYYEAILSPIRDENGKLHGVMAAGRNITEMVESHHKQEEEVQFIQKTTKQIQAYIQNINYTLKASGVRLITYHPRRHELLIFSDLNKVQYRLSQIRCASLIHESDRRKLRGLFMRMDQGKAGNISEVLHTIFHDPQRRDIYMNFSLIPMTDKDGHVTQYFGLCRDETEMKYTEMHLIEKTKKAQETEELKNTFLLNMSYEIRTPLNAVLGFAELFNSPHDVEDEPVFAEEIKRNTDELLSLVNDILFVSRLDAKMVEFTKDACDFATLFDGWCYMGWSALGPNVKVVIDNPYNHLVLNIDEQHLGQAIQKICTCSASYTDEGMVRAKYEYHHGELNIVIEDTGKGVRKEVMPHVFDRFVKDDQNKITSTGLDMPIVKELVEQMGGQFEIQSELGKGTTCYLMIPCEMISREKKTEITTN
jgi:signal transduction histidine kinase